MIATSLMRPARPTELESDPTGAFPRFRVAHLLPWNTVGGIEIATLRIAEGVRERGVESVFFCPAGSGEAHRMLERAGFLVERYEVAELSLRRPASFLSMSWRLAAKLRHHNVDLLHCADLQAAYNGGLAAKLAGIRLLCHIRSRYADLSRRDQLLLAPVAHFVFVSEGTRARFALRLPLTRTSVVYDGIDVAAAPPDPGARAEFRREFEIPADAPVIGMVARVAEVKDYFTLVRAAKRIASTHPEAVVLIVGDNDSTPNYRRHFAEVKRFIDAQGLADHFVFTGHREDVDRALSTMDVFVLSTHQEGLPLVLLEAAAHALPIVATNVDGVPEIVAHRETGLLSSPGDDLDLAELILECLRDRVFAARLGDAARSQLRETFSTGRFADGMAAVYRTLIDHSPRMLIEGKP